MLAVYQTSTWPANSQSMESDDVVVETHSIACESVFVAINMSKSGFYMAFSHMPAVAPAVTVRVSSSYLTVQQTEAFIQR